MPLQLLLLLMLALALVVLLLIIRVMRAPTLVQTGTTALREDEDDCD